MVVRRGGLTAQVGGLHRKALAEQFRAANLLFLREQGHVFGKGAVQAAKFLAGKPAGMYNMSNVIDAAM